MQSPAAAPFFVSILRRSDGSFFVGDTTEVPERSSGQLRFSVYAACAGGVSIARS
jgi:hypothetical protein